jgi:hypothetical protein
MRRQPRDLRPPEWVIRSSFVPRRDGLRRLGQAFQVLLGSSPDHNTDLEYHHRSAVHADRDLCQGLDRQAGAGPDD